LECGWMISMWHAGAGGLNPPVMGPTHDLQVVMLYWLKWLACSSWFHTSGLSG
jgi:hypothetical protein